MLTKFGWNIVIAVFVVNPLLWYLGFFGSPFFHFLQTLVMGVTIAVALSPKWADPLMDPVAGACINKKRLLPAGAQTHLTFAYIFGKAPTVEAVTESMKILLNYERFTSVPVEAPNAMNSSWKKIENFNLSDYIFHHNVSSTEELEKQINDLTVGTLRPLESNKALWRVDILDNSNGDSAVCWMFDHCMGDALSMLPIGLTMTRKLNGEPYQMETFQPNRGAGIPWLTRFKNALTDFKEVLMIPNGPFDTSCNFNRNADKKVFDYNGQRQVLNVEFDFSDITAIKSKLPAGYTINDIFTALWSGTIRRYLQKTNDPALKGPVLLRGQAPFAIPRTPVPNKTLNKIAFVVFNLPVGLETIQKRLESIHNEFMDLKTSIKVPLIQFVASFGLKLGLDVPLCVTNLQQWHRTSCIFSNVAGPRERLLVWGEELKSFRPYYCNMLTQAIVFTYAGRGAIAMVLDTSNITKPELLPVCWNEELNAMKDLKWN